MYGDGIQSSAGVSAWVGGQAGHTLEVDGVRLSFGEKHVLGSVYLKIEAGRVTGLVGRNGSGKSCLMRLMHGSFGVGTGGFGWGSATVEGSVRINGKLVAHACMHGVMYLPQHGFIPGGRLVKNVLRDYGLDFESFVARFPGMIPHSRSVVATLSGGERRILEVFIVLASPWSRFCLLDEPFSQVSPLHAGVLKTMIGEAAHAGKGILISDHLYRDICEVSDDLYIIADNATRRVTSPDDLRKYGYLR